MAKEKKPPMTLDEENASKLYGGITTEQLDAALTRLGELNAEKAEILGDISAAQEAFDKQGGDKWCLKVLGQLERMEDSKAEARLRTLFSYINARGLFEQLDLFDALPAGTGLASAAQKGAEPSVKPEASTH